MTEDKAVTLGAEERALLLGDLAKLDSEQRGALYRSVCTSLGLNYLTRPFDYLTLSGRLVLYAKKDATDQLRAIHGISVRIGKPDVVADVLYVAAHASTANGRTDEDLGAVYIGGLRGEALANAHMKAITKAKRRVTLSIAGLGMLDDTEVDSIPGARRLDEQPAPQLNPHQVDTTTGEIDESAPAPANWVQRLHKRNAEIIERFGHDEAIPVPVKVTRGDAEQIGALQTKILGAVEVPA